MIEDRLEMIVDDCNKCVNVNWFYDMQTYKEAFSTTPQAVWETLKNVFERQILVPYKKSPLLGKDKNFEAYFNELLPSVFLSTYYYGIDYLYRQQGTTPYNYNYIKNIVGQVWELQDEADFDDISTIFDRTRKKVPAFITSLKEVQDENYRNPYLVKRQKEFQRSNYERETYNLFLGNCISFLKKICMIEREVDAKYYSRQVTNNSKIVVNNVLSTLTLLLFEAIPDLPAHKNTISGNWTVERILDLDNLLWRYDEFAKVGISNKNKEFDRLLTQFAIEDLFHLKRISDAIYLYLDYLKEHPNLPQNVQQKILLTQTSHTENEIAP